MVCVPIEDQTTLLFMVLLRRECPDALGQSLVGLFVCETVQITWPKPDCFYPLFVRSLQLEQEATFYPLPYLYTWLEKCISLMLLHSCVRLPVP